jgi:exosortase/archaeosortase family protein
LTTSGRRDHSALVSQSYLQERGSPLWLRIGLFLLLYGGLHGAYQALRDSRFDPWFIHELTVRPAAGLIAVLFPGDAVAAAGPRLVWPEGRLTLLAGCDGFEVMSLFIAAVLVADVGWRRGLIALVVGCAAVWALNQARIAALYWSFRYQREWFDAVHTAWGPLLLVVAVAALYAWAIGWWSLDRRAEAAVR